MAEYKCICAVCGKEYFAKHPSPNNKYCSRECSRKGYNAILAKRKEEMEYKHRVPTDEELVWAMANRDKLNDLMNMVERLEGITNRGYMTLYEIKNLIAGSMSKLAEIDNEDGVADNYTNDAKMFFNKFIYDSIYEIIDPSYINSRKSRSIEIDLKGYTELIYSDEGDRWSSYKEDFTEGACSYPMKDGRLRGAYLGYHLYGTDIYEFIKNFKCNKTDCEFCKGIIHRFGKDLFCIPKLFYSQPWFLENDTCIRILKEFVAKDKKDALDKIKECEFLFHQ